MSVIILQNQSNASRRVVPLPPLVQSNGTSSCTNESGNTFFFSVGGVFYGSGGSISAVSAPIGLYECLFSASKVSVVGQGRVWYSSNTALPASTPIEVVNYDSYDSMRFGQFALPNAIPTTAAGLLTLGVGAGQIQPSAGSVGLIAQTHSQATIGGVNNILAGTYSGVTFGINNIAPNIYSGVSVEVKTGGIQTVSIGAGNYSGMSVEVKTKGIDTNSINSATYSSVSFRLQAGDYSSIVTVGVGNIAAGSYSGVTIQGVSNTSSAASILTDIWAPAVHSGVTLEINNIKPNAYSGVTVDGAKFLSPAGERSAASSLLSTNMGGTTPRLFQQGWELLRNKVLVSGSTMTVFKGDDVTSSWTATISTGTATVYGVAPGIA